MQGLHVQSLVRELRSHMPPDQKTKTWNKSNTATNSTGTLITVHIKKEIQTTNNLRLLTLEIESRINHVIRQAFNHYALSLLNTWTTWCEELTHWKKPWCWERLKAGGEGDDRGWDGWMASPTRWKWIWASSGSWWWTGKPGVLQSMELQRVGHDWATELNWRREYDSTIQETWKKQKD